MQKLDLQLGGHPSQIDDLNHLQTGVMDVIKGICEGLRGSTQAFILQGCDYTLGSGTFTMSTGYIYFNGEVYPYDGGTYALPVPVGQAYYWVPDTTLSAFTLLPPSPVLYQDSILKDVHVRNRFTITLALTSSPPINSFLVSNLERLSQIIKQVPQQGIIMYSGLSTNFDSTGAGIYGTPVYGYALCNGNTFNIPDTLTSIITPDLRGKFIVGLDTVSGSPTHSVPDVDYNAIGKVGGEKTHALTIAEMPRHMHKIAANDGLGTNGGTVSGDWDPSSALTDDAGMSSGYRPGNTSLKGGNTGVMVEGNGIAHENRPPFYTLAYIMKLR